ncbi:MAG TPA: thioredoxin domain-containing protein [Burkholderiales bacterium]|nr:thioredoxin domain-containing protein [Burkholderiales bacterium]
MRGQFGILFRRDPSKLCKELRIEGDENTTARIHAPKAIPRDNSALCGTRVAAFQSSQSGSRVAMGFAAVSHPNIEVNTMRTYQVHTPGRLTESLNKHDHFQGALDAPIALVEYGDYQCPFCRAADGVVKAIQREFGNSLCYAFRNFPLYTIHEFAVIAAQAAESAALQGRFWQMHDILFANQPNFALEDLMAYAASLSLDIDAFVDGMEDPRVLHRIEHDMRTGLTSGVQGTPTFYINDVKYEGGADTLRAALLAMTKTPTAVA